MSDEVVDMYLRPWSSQQGKKAFFRNLRRLNSEYTEAIAGELRNLPHETLILWADKDVFQKPAYATQFKDVIPNAKLTWIKDTGHWLIEEKPEEISQLIGSFLNDDKLASANRAEVIHHGLRAS